MTISLGATRVSFQALGFIRTGIIRDADHFKGATSDDYRYELPPPTPREA